MLFFFLFGVWGADWNGTDQEEPFGEKTLEGGEVGEEIGHDGLIGVMRMRRKLGLGVSCCGLRMSIGEGGRGRESWMRMIWVGVFRGRGWI